MILRADARAIPLADESVQCCVTSPPYWGLRDYGTPGQLGLCKTPEEYVANMVAVFREVRRALKDDGILWLNLGDSYAMNFAGGKGRRSTAEEKDRAIDSEDKPRRIIPFGLKPKDLVGVPWRVAFALQADGWYLRSDIIWAKPNPMPESVTDRPTKAHEYIFLMSKSAKYYYDAGAIAEPIQTDPSENYPARAHILGRGNQESSNAPIGAPRRDNSGGYAPKRWPGIGPKHGESGARLTSKDQPYKNGMEMHDRRNRRTVWNIATQPYSGSHFATFPEEIPRLCILAGSLPLGADEPDDFIMTPTGEGDREPDPSFLTGRAGFDRPRRRREGTRAMTRMEQAAYAEQLRDSLYRPDMEKEAGGGTTFDHYVRTDRSGARAIPPLLLDAWIERGWLDEVSIPPRKAHFSRSVVLDPFGGSGTTSKVALELGRKPVHIDLTYHELARKRMTTTPAMAGLMR